MNFHRVSHLNHQGVRINELVIHSYEMGVYLAEAEYDGRKAFLQDETGRAQRSASCWTAAPFVRLIWCISPRMTKCVVVQSTATIR